MKKIAVILLICVLAIPIAFAELSVSKDIPNEVEKGEYFKVILNINTDSARRFDAAEFIPLGWEISEWEVKPKLNVDFDSQTQEFFGSKHNMNHWKFYSVAEEITIEYTVYAEELGEYDFITLWVHPKGFNSLSEKVNVVEAKPAENGGVITGLAITENLEDQTQENIPEPDLNIVNIEKTRDSISHIKNLMFSVQY